MTALQLTPVDNPAATREFMVSLFDGKFRSKMDELPDELRALSQAEIEKLRRPSEIDYKLRERLWALADNAFKSGVLNIQAIRLHEGILSPQGFDALLDHPVRVIWLTLRPTDDKHKMKTLLQMLLQKIELEVLPKAITDNNLSAFLKLVEFLTNRVHGPMIQRLDTRNLNVNVEKKALITSPDDLDKKIKELHSEIQPTVIEVKGSSD